MTRQTAKPIEGRLYAIDADAGPGTGRSQIVGQRRADEHPEGKQRRVAVAFPGHEELAAGAAAREREGEPGGDHAEVVPHKVAVGHGLALKAELEAAGQGVGDEGGGEHGREPEEKVGVAEKEEIAESPHRAEAAALRDDPDDEGQTPARR